MTQNSKISLIHWSDITADRIIRQKGEKDVYTLPQELHLPVSFILETSGETITVDLVARALRKRGKNVRFIFSWDDYDTFRKILKIYPSKKN